MTLTIRAAMLRNRTGIGRRQKATDADVFGKTEEASMHNGALGRPENAHQTLVKQREVDRL